MDGVAEGDFDPTGGFVDWSGLLEKGGVGEGSLDGVHPLGELRIVAVFEELSFGKLEGLDGSVFLLVVVQQVVDQ